LNLNTLKRRAEVFASGKAIIAGLKSSDQLESIVQKLIDIIK